jgi:hypothetical protein
MYSAFFFVGLFIGLLLGWIGTKIHSRLKGRNFFGTGVNVITPEEAMKTNPADKVEVNKMKKLINKELKAKMQTTNDRIGLKFYTAGYSLLYDCYKPRIIMEALDYYRSNGWDISIENDGFADVAWMNIIFQPKKDYIRVQMEAQQEIEEVFKEPTQSRTENRRSG